MTRRMTQAGFTVVELVISIGIAALLLTGLMQMLNTSLSVMDVVEDRTDLARPGRFAMARMVDAVRGSDHLLLPLADNPATTFDENVRGQTVPASPPQSGSTLATAVLAVTLDRTLDIDGNGIFDADNDGDGRFDEDLPADTQYDNKAGIQDIDDDGNGVKDFWLSPAGDDDESNDFSQSEDTINGIDDDGDGSIDEDPGADNNGDGAPGIAGVEDGGGLVSGLDFVESTIADNVTLLRFERILPSGGQQQLIDITLTLSDSVGETINLNARVRLGGLQ